MVMVIAPHDDETLPCLRRCEPCSRLLIDREQGSLLRCWDVFMTFQICDALRHKLSYKNE